MRKMNRQDMLIVISFTLIQIIYFSFVSWGKNDWINTDAVPYIRIAQYYATGQFDLMVSGYWGPLLSWIIAPLLNFVKEPVSAAHIAMGISSLVFLLGSLAILRAMELSPSATFVALVIVVLFSVNWSIRFITPDILVSGILCLAISRIMITDWCKKTSVQFLAGILFGVAYLAKAIALPLACMVIIAASTLWFISQQISLARAFRNATITFLGLILIAGPWILLLSFKYERPVFSTSAEINHTVVGPSDKERGHPHFRQFQIPEKGRVTWWEDPNPAAYASWSPLESPEHLGHQLKVIVKNGLSSINTLRFFDWLGIGLISVILGFLFHLPWRENMRLHPWRWSAVFIGCLVGIYLPVAGRDMRYYLAAYPFVLGGGLGFVGSLAKDPTGRNKFLYIMAIVFVSLSFFVPLATIPTPKTIPDYQAAKILKEKLQANNITGPLASISESQILFHIAYYTAFLMEKPFHGNFPQAQTVEDVQSASAKILVVEKGTIIDSQLKKNEAFIGLDENLFDSLKEELEPGVNIYINTK